MQGRGFYNLQLFNCINKLIFFFKQALKSRNVRKIKQKPINPQFTQ